MNEAAGMLTLALVAGVERNRVHGRDAYATARLILVENELRQARAWIDIFRRRMQAIPPRNRPQYTAAERSFILRTAAEKGWSANKIANYIVADDSSVRNWLRAWAGLFQEK